MTNSVTCNSVPCQFIIISIPTRFTVLLSMCLTKCLQTLTAPDLRILFNHTSISSSTGELLITEKDSCLEHGDNIPRGVSDRRHYSGYPTHHSDYTRQWILTLTTVDPGSMNTDGTEVHVWVDFPASRGDRSRNLGSLTE